MNIEATIPAPMFGPPTPIILDGVTFFDVGSDAEIAFAGKSLVGELRINSDSLKWIARKRFRPVDDLGAWRPMRCKHEARAFIVSGYRV